MAPIVSNIEVARPPDEVFAYVTDPSRFAEWQENVVGGRIEGDGPPTVGSTFTTTRRLGPRERTMKSRITELGPPRRWAMRGVDGPVRAIVDVTVEPLAGNARSRVTIALDFEGHGIGKALVPLVVRRQAQKEMPRNVARLGERLESAGSAPTA